jgi:signal transduction histidine kinase
MNTDLAIPNRRVLVIDDNVAIHSDFRKILTGDDGKRAELLASRAALFGETPKPAISGGFDVDFAHQGQAGFTMVEQALAQGVPYAVAFVDMRMPPGWDGVETIEHLWKADPELQVVICTAFSDHAWEQVIERLGQTDRLLILRKPFDSIEAWQITNALSAKWSLQRAARMQRDTLEDEVAARTEALIGTQRLLERKIYESLRTVEQAQQAKANAEAIKQELIATNIILNAEAEQRMKREAELVQATETLQKEIAARQRAEQQFLQSQKLEAVGRLAGGVAHDFNNILTVILGTSEILLSRHDLNGSRGMVEEISKAAERAAELTRQLLTFSRQEIVTQVTLSLNAVVTDAEKMLRRVVKENIRLDLKLSTAPRCVKADPGQMEQVLMNLVVNASDAMPDGGRISIETSATDPDAALRHSNAGERSGAFVRLTVSDTGCGMDERTKARICEPFFTTKAKGEGTGLGLATVYGIIREAGGWIDVESQPGRGSTFHVYLPECLADEVPAMPAIKIETAPCAQRRAETVLLVEDEDILRRLLQKIMADSGYRVLAASNGQEAIRLCEEHAGPIHILLTDLVLPGMSGRQISEHVSNLRAGIPVLFMSGYTDDEQVRQGIRASSHQFLQKPFTPTALTHKLRDVMGAGLPPLAESGRFNS